MEAGFLRVPVRTRAAGVRTVGCRAAHPGTGRCSFSAPRRSLNSRAADRYEIDPADQLRIDTGARQRGLSILGVYHSHPDHPAEPSETDRARAEEIWRATESWLYLILEVAAGKDASWGSWVLRGGVFEPEEVRLAPPPGPEEEA